MKIATRISKLPKYVGGKPIDELQRELGIDRPIKLASNENPNGPSPKSLEALSKSILDVASYPDGDSYHLKRKICEKERRKSICIENLQEKKINLQKGNLIEIPVIPFKN